MNAAGTAAGTHVIVVFAHVTVVWLGSDLIETVDKVASRTVGTEPNRMVSPTQIGLVLGVSRDGSELLFAVGKLAFISVFTAATLLKRSAQLSLVSTGIDFAVVFVILVAVVVVVVRQYHNLVLLLQCDGKLVELEQGVGTV